MPGKLVLLKVNPPKIETSPRYLLNVLINEAKIFYRAKATTNTPNSEPATQQAHYCAFYVREN
jgi:hypothetical protein